MSIDEDEKLMCLVSISDQERAERVAHPHPYNQVEYIGSEESLIGTLFLAGQERTA